MRNILPLLLAAFVVAVVLALGWLFGTGAGARFVLDLSGRYTPVRIEAQEVSGRLATGVILRGLKVQWPDGGAETEALTIRWQPLRLLSGRLQVDELSALNMNLTLPPEAEKPASPPVEEPFRLPALKLLPFGWRGGVEELRLDEITLRRGDETTTLLNELQASLDWQSGRLTVRRLEARAPAGRLSGTGHLDFSRPELGLDLTYLPPDSSGFDRVTLEADLTSAPGERTLSGPLQLVGWREGTAVLPLSGTFVWEPTRLRLAPGQLEWAELPGRLEGEALLEQANGAWRYALEVQASGVDLQRWTPFATDLSARISLSGTSAGYQGQVEVTQSGPGWRELRLNSPVSGTFEEVQFSRIAGSWLDGSVSGRIGLDWRSGFALDGELDGDGLDPRGLHPDWAGRLRLTTRGRLQTRPEEPLQAELSARIGDSRLLDRTVRGEIDLRLSGDDLQLSSLQLRGDGFDLQARGRLRERVALQIDISRLGGLWPGWGGRLAGKGWLRWRDRMLSGEGEFSGRDLDLAGIGIARIDFSARSAAGVLSVRGAAEQLHVGSYLFERATLLGEGTLRRHRLELTGRGEQLSGQIVAAGGVDSGRWQGTVSELSLRAGSHPAWTLVAPVELTAGSDRLRLSELTLRGGAAEQRLSVRADLSAQPWHGLIAGSWSRFPLEQLAFWTRPLQLSGESSGSVQADWLGKERVDWQVRLESSAGVAHEDWRLELARGGAELRWDGQGLRASTDLDLDLQGRAELQLVSSEPGGWRLPRAGTLEGSWRELDLGLFSPWLKGAQLQGRSSGDLFGQLKNDGRLELGAGIGWSGVYNQGGVQLRIQRGDADLAWNADGFSASLAIEREEGGTLTARIRSAEPPRWGLPTPAEIEAAWQEIDLARLGVPLPPGIELAGILSGRCTGHWFGEEGWALQGAAEVAGGSVTWQQEAGQMVAPFRETRFSWDWSGNLLAGDLSLSLENLGKLSGRFRLPLPARFPVAIAADQPLSAEVTGELRELGLIEAIFPGATEETRGQVELKGRVDGTWAEPRLSGELSLSGAGAYFPGVGLSLSAVEARAELVGDELRLHHFEIHSGKGVLNGDLILKLDRFRPRSYSGHLAGKDFLAVDLPELRIVASPALTFSGQGRKLTLRGEIDLPEVMITGRESRSPVPRSQDVIIVDAPAAAEPRLELDAEIVVRLGDQVRVKVQGVDARLEGTVRLRAESLEKIRGYGEIRVVQGTYSAYGVQLKITRGGLIFTGGPVDQPSLDILALRESGEVKAGVRVTGTPRQPKAALYSEPTMPDTDILSYIVLGHAYSGEEGGQTGLLMTAAGALLSQGESSVLQDRLKRGLGLDVIEVQAGGDEATGSTLTIGKYLSPDLYISFGRSLFTEANEVRLRYDLKRRWQLESKVGNESSVDLYYKILFD